MLVCFTWSDLTHPPASGAARAAAPKRETGKVATTERIAKAERCSGSDEINETLAALLSPAKQLTKARR